MSGKSVSGRESGGYQATISSDATPSQLPCPTKRLETMSLFDNDADEILTVQPCDAITCDEGSIDKGEPTDLVLFPTQVAVVKPPYRGYETD